MRGRRNTNLSIATPSLSSATPSPVTACDSADQGRFLLIPTKEENVGLPSPLLKHAQESQARQSYYKRVTVQITRQYTLFVVVLTFFFLWRSYLFFSNVPTFLGQGEPPQYALAKETVLSDRPEPIVLQMGGRRNRWTLSIPHNASFPLRHSQYKDLCSTCTSTSRALRQSLQGSNRLHKKSLHSDSYYAIDPTYMDIHEAESHGLLPDSSHQAPITVVGRDSPAASESHDLLRRTCERSLTFILDTEEAGFGKSLLSLWMSYGLARREKRAFFIDDSHWQYGRYKSFFPAPPLPDCIPPPPSHVVPCPHHAAHLAVSAATLSYTFGEKFQSHFERSRRSDVSRQKLIFDMARRGYEDLFGLVGEDELFARHRIDSIRERAKVNQHPVAGMHVRRGDRHPFEYEFHHDYLPLERFTSAIQERLSTTSLNASSAIPLYVASDDPDTTANPDQHILASSSPPMRLERVQERIVLASKRNLLPSAPQRDGNSAFVKHVEEVSGWEGGFFAPLFRSLGRPNKANHLTFHTAREHRVQVEERIREQREQYRQGVQKSLVGSVEGKERKPSDEEKRIEDNASAMRELVGRAYLLDLQVLGQSDQLVCAVSSATCRVLGVMMGWEAVMEGAWWNVDDGRAWSWDGEH